jgi:uncharacterized protein YndB with AHSA1/START domain
MTNFEIIRLYDATVEQVWDAWSDISKIAQWWGPRGFSITHKSKELKMGGQWVYTMHGPDGVDYPNVALYHEVIPFKKLVYDHGASGDKPALFQVTAIFTSVAGKTQLHLTMSMATNEAAQEIKKFIKQVHGNSTWDRLAEFLANEKKKSIFVINRCFEKDLMSVYNAWLDPEKLVKWLAPTGFSMKFLECNVIPKGSSLYCMSNGEVTMYNKIFYEDISLGKQLVYTQTFVDREGGISRHPGLPVFPETMRTTVEFAAEGESLTRVTVQWEPYGHFTAEEVTVFESIRPSMMQGFSGSFAALEQFLGCDSF